MKIPPTTINIMLVALVITSMTVVSSETPLPGLGKAEEVAPKPMTKVVRGVPTACTPLFLLATIEAAELAEAAAVATEAAEAAAAAEAEAAAAAEAEAAAVARAEAAAAQAAEARAQAQAAVQKAQQYAQEQEVDETQYFQDQPTVPATAGATATTSGTTVSTVDVTHALADYTEHEADQNDAQHEQAQQANVAAIADAIAQMTLADQDTEGLCDAADATYYDDAVALQATQGDDNVAQITQENTEIATIVEDATALCALCTVGGAE